MKKTINKIGIALLAVVLFTTACKKEYLDTAPSDDVSGDVVFETTQGAYVALNGTYRSMYRSLTNHGNFGQKSYDLMADLMGEDMVVHKAGYNWFNREYNYSEFALAAPDTRSDRAWYYYYRLINNANLIIEKIDGATGTDAEKNNIKGQALAIRANSYFYLINYFQQSYKGNESKPGVPLYTEPTSVGNPRGTVQQVYDQIIADLNEAETLLAGQSRIHKSHINQKTVQGIHARVALIMENWTDAAKYAKLARAGITPMTTSQYTGSGFNTLSTPEWIWGLEVIGEQATIYASFWSHMDVTTGGYADLGTQKKITKALYDKIPEGDIRKEVFVRLDDPKASNDYPPLNQIKFHVPQPGNWAADYLLMRASEMYLIEAEAAFRSGDAGTASTVLEELVKSRYPAYSVAAFSGQALLDEILLQRKIELWGEGVSVLDVKRLGKGLNRPEGPGNHNGSDLLPKPGVNFPTSIVTMPNGDPRFLLRIPQAELNANNALTSADQNP